MNLEPSCQVPPLRQVASFLMKIVNNATSFVFIFTGGWGKALKAKSNLYTEEQTFF